MPEDEFKISDLREALLQERNSKQLTKIKDSFYRRLRQYLKELEEEVEELGFPSDSRSKAVHREYSKAKNHAEDLFSRRAQKVALASVHYSSGSKKVDTDNMTKREEKLFFDMVDLIEEMEEEIFFGGYKREVKPKKEDKKVDEVVKNSDKKEPKKERVPSNEDTGADEFSKEKKSAEKLSEISSDEISSKVSSGGSPSEILIHVIEKIPPFVDMDATYDLKKEDVVTLREDIANVLINRGKARKIVLD